MKLLTQILVVILLWALHCTNANESRNRQFKYHYSGSTLVRNKASDNVYAHWKVSGELTIQHVEGRYQIFKLDNVKTSVFNGVKSSSQPKEQEPLVDVQHLTSPFAVYYYEDDVDRLTIHPEEPIWSANIKRAIASIFNVKTSVSSGHTEIENTLHGNCEVTYEVSETKEHKKYTKIINHDNCTNVPEVTWSNVDKIKDELSFERSTMRDYTFEKNTGDLKYIQASFNVTHVPSTNARGTHHLYQEQSFTLKEVVDGFILFQGTKESETKTFRFDTGDDEPEKKSQDKIDKDFMKALKEFRKQQKARPLASADIRKQNLIDNLHISLSDMDYDTMSNLGRLSARQSHIFLSLLPYIGTDAAMDMIELVVTFNLISDLLLVRLLATFPSYINSPSKETLNKFKFLTNLDVNNTQVKYAGILSFGALVADTNKRSDVPSEDLSKYISNYNDAIINSDEYEKKMTYLLGLINMGPAMEDEYILDVITNHNLNYHLRILGTFGFKPYLINSDYTFKRLWPIVQNVSEHFEVRVAAFDVLMSSNLSEDDFNKIVNTFDHRPKSPEEEHLSNYFYSSLQSLDNSTPFTSPLSEKATAILRTRNIPKYTKSWVTGNYRFAYSDVDGNFGTSFQTRLVGTPVSNELNIIHLSFDRFEMNLMMESYTAYINIEGVFDDIFMNFMLSTASNTNSVQTLVDLIKKCGYEIKLGKDIHVEIAIFSNGKAVFGIHLNKDNIDNYTDNELFIEAIQLVIYYNSISFPLLNYHKTASDIGTAVVVDDNTEQVTYQEVENFEQIPDDEIEIKNIGYHYKSSNAYTSVLKSTNPLAKTNIVVYKRVTNEQSLDIPIKFNSTSYILAWKNKNDTFNWVFDSLLGTAVEDKEVLKKYCSGCDMYSEIPIGTKMEKVEAYPELGFKILGSRTGNCDEQRALDKIDPPRRDPFSHVQNTHNGQAFAFPFAKPVMYIDHFIHYLKSMLELQSFSIKSAITFDEEYETEVELGIFGDTVKIDNDPIDGDKVNVFCSFTNKNSKGKILSGVNTTFLLTTTPKYTDGQSKPYLEQVFAFYSDSFVDEGEKFKICINGDLLYPARRADKLSLKPVKPAKGKITFAFGEVDSLNNCSEQHIKFTELYTATESKNRKVEESEDYKTCKKDANGLNYIPPTQACINAHRALSKYDVYGLYGDFTNSEDYDYFEERLEKTKWGNKILEYNYIDQDHINISMAFQIGNIVFGISNKSLLEFEEKAAVIDFLSVDPTAVAYDDYDDCAGLTNTCYVTPSTVRNFAGHYEPVFQENDKEVVAFVECYNETHSGLTVQKINDKTLGFKYWMKGNELDVTVENGKIKALFNNEQITKTPEEQDEDIKIYFLENDVVYISDSLQDIYYTTEYISVKALSIYNNYICGKCGYNIKG